MTISCGIQDHAEHWMRLLAGISSLILRYGVLTWAAPLKLKYISILSEAVCVITAMIAVCITRTEDVEFFREEDCKHEENGQRIRRLSDNKSGTTRITAGEPTGSFQRQVQKTRRKLKRERRMLLVAFF